MTDLTTGGVIAEMRECRHLLAQLTDRLDGADATAVNAKLDYEHAYEIAFLKSEGPQYLREVIAKNAASDQRRAVEDAAREVRSIKAHLDTVHKRIDLIRSEWSALKAEMAMDGMR